MLNIKLTKSLPVTVEFCSILCSNECPQLGRYAADDDQCHAWVCGYYNTRMMTEHDVQSVLRCAGCRRDFGMGEQSEQSEMTTLRKSMTASIECPLCGKRADVVSIHHNASVKANRQ